MTRPADKGKTAKGVKKLSVKKETVKDLDSKPGTAGDLGDDQLDAVRGGVGRLDAQGLPKSRRPAECRPFRTTRLSNCCS